MAATEAGLSQKDIQGIPKTREVSKGARQIVLQFNKDGLAESPHGQKAKDVIRGINLVGAWATERSNASLDNVDADQIRMVNDQASRIADLSELMLNFKSSSKDYTEEFQKLFANASTDVNNKPDDTSPIVITINSQNQLKRFFSQDLATITHDLNGPITRVKAVYEMVMDDMTSAGENKAKHTFEEFKPVIERGFQGIAREITTWGENIVRLGNEYLSPNMIENFFNNELRLNYISSGFNADNMNLSINGPVKNQLFMCPPQYIEGVLKNVLGNTVKIYKKDPQGKDKTFSIHIKLGENGGIDIVCDDQGPGYSDAIIENGFIGANKKGIHGYADPTIESKGKGLANWERLLRRKGATLTPDRNPTGGARTIIHLPTAA